MNENLLFLERGGDLAAVFFAARGSGREFGFYRIAHQLSATALLVKDPTNNWYNAGIDGLGATVDEIAASLRATVGNRRIVTFGSSMGGYAAILFGCLLGAEGCVALAPQTRLDSKLPLSPPAGMPLQAPELRRYLLESPSTNVRIFIGGSDLVDAYHAYRVADLPNVEVSVLADAGHSVAETLAGTDILREVVAATLAGTCQVPAGFEAGIEDAALRHVIEDAVERHYFGGDPVPSLQTLLTARPRWAGAHQFLGQRYLSAKRFVEAERVLRDAVQANADWYVPYRYLGEALMRQGRLAEAERALRQAVEMRPTWGWAQWFLAECLYRQGQDEEADSRFAVAAGIESGAVTMRTRLMNEVGRAP
jgi:tetratricopeptide (TPR) repeat protein